MEKLIIATEPYIGYQKYKKLKEQYQCVEEFEEFDINAYQALSMPSLFSVGETKGVFIRMPELTVNDLLVDYLKEPKNVGDLIVMVGKANKTLKVYKAFSDVDECRRPKEQDLLTFIARKESDEGCRITQDAAHHMIAAYGYYDKDTESSLFDIVTTVKYLSGLTNEITLPVVQQYVVSESSNAYTLCQLYFENRTGELMQNIRALQTKKGFSSIATLSLMNRNFRCLIQHIECGMALPYGVYRPRELSLDRLREGMEVITGYIRKVKAGTVPDQVALEYAVIELMGI